MTIGHNSPADMHIDKDDPRYQSWLKAYDTLLNATPAPLREVLQPSLGTLSSRLVLVLFPQSAERDNVVRLARVDELLEKIIINLTESGKIGAAPGKPGALNPLEFESLKAAQDALSVLRKVTL